MRGNAENWEIRSKYIGMVNRYENEKNLAKKIAMKYKFIAWFRDYEYRLTDAEQEYLQQSICYVIDD